MSLERRLLLLLLLCAPLVWAIGLGLAASRAQVEVNELFDTELIQLAGQLQATLKPSVEAAPAVASAASATSARPPAREGEADLQDMAVAAWDRSGRLLLTDREGALLPYDRNASGFRELALADEAWRVYYLRSVDGHWLVAAGQKSHERDELVLSLTLGQLLPWLLMLPVLMLAMAWAVRCALAPLRQLTGELSGRSAEALQPMAALRAPSELRPLLAAMNGLFERIEQTLARERRFTADAAHELRTPLAVLRAQWDVVRRASGAQERAQAEAALGAGLDRLDRLVTQMLALSRLEGGSLPHAAVRIDWQPVVEQALSDCLLLAGRRDIEFACEFPPGDQPALPLLGDAELLTVMLRNLLDNAARYAPRGSTVQLRLLPDSLVVDNEGRTPPDEQLARLGERFYRPAGQEEAGSGLGLSIVRRIAALHGLAVALGRPDRGQGFRVRLGRVAPVDPA